MKSLLLCPSILLLFLPAASAFGQQDKKETKPWPANKVNSALSFARMATAEQRFQDSETLMLQVTEANPQQVLAWVELGNAQLGLKKYTEAENSFKTALGLKPMAENAAPPAPAAPAPDKTEDLVEQYIRSLPQPVSNSGGLHPLGGDSGGAPPPGGTSDSPPAPGPAPSLAASASSNRPPQVAGPVYASLGEVYAHEGKVAEAQAAFNQAVALLPDQAAQYRGNETIVFFQTGQADAQLAAAKQAIALDPERPSLYYFEGQALVGKATIDPKTQKLILAPECVDAFKKYLKLSPNGRLAAEVRGILSAAGIAPDK
jgi:tetratricopeptide (TPR) repeat protein